MTYFSKFPEWDLIITIFQKISSFKAQQSRQGNQRVYSRTGGSSSQSYSGWHPSGGIASSSLEAAVLVSVDACSSWIAERKSCDPGFLEAPKTRIHVLLCRQ